MTTAAKAFAVALIVAIASSATLADFTGEYTSWREKFLDPATILHLTGCVASKFDYNTPADLSKTIKLWYYATMNGEYDEELCAIYFQFSLGSCYERKIPQSHVNFILYQGRQLCARLAKEQLARNTSAAGDDFTVDLPLENRTDV